MLDVSQKHTQTNIQTNMIVTDLNENRIARDFIAIFTRLKFLAIVMPLQAYNLSFIIQAIKRKIE